nr:uncharacterized protein LOC106683788 [Halyomorpha halys]
MEINTSKIKILQVGRQVENLYVYCNGEEMEVVADITYLGAIIDRSGKIDPEISNRIKKAYAADYQIYNTVIGKREIGMNVKLHIYKSVFLPILLFGAESWILTDRQESRLTTTEMKFLGRTVGKAKRDHVRNKRIRQELGIVSVKKVLQIRQLEWFGHVIRMEEHRDSQRRWSIYQMTEGLVDDQGCPTWSRSTGFVEQDGRIFVRAERFPTLIGTIRRSKRRRFPMPSVQEICFYF